MTPVPARAPQRFALMRWFTLATAGVFAAATVALVVLQRMEETFFEKVQRDQQAFVAAAQAELVRQTEAAARASLLAVHESAHVTLTSVVAELMWATDFAPVVARAQALAVEPCRAQPADAADGAVAAGRPAAGRRACLAALGARIRALPGHAALHARAQAAMAGTRVFKVKVWDMRGVCVYSSEAAQTGDDGAANEGWRRAAAGTPASELTHRDRFSAFEGVVENRDLISSYVPVRAGGAVVGVFELYSDVTPFLDQIKAASRRFADLSAANETRIETKAQSDRDTLYDSSSRFLLTVGGLMSLLYLASLAIVRIGQRFIDRQWREQEGAAAREQRWHQEKMAALAAMAANVSHEVGNPLAVIAAQAQLAPELPGSRQILEQTERIARMTRRICDFASANGAASQWVDVNALVRAVCDFHAFDRRWRGISVDLQAAAGLPALELVPDHLNEALMNLLQAAADAAAPGPACIEVRTGLREGDIVIAVAGKAFTGDARLDTARRRAAEMGGRLLLAPARAEIALPVPPAD